MKLKILSLCAFIALLSASAIAQYRTVIDKEVGSLFQKPGGFSYSSYGAFVGTPGGALDVDALQVMMARFDKFSPNDSKIAKGFPYSALKSYEAQEVAAGRAPIFITATYKGKKRPVLWGWSLKVNSSNVPTTSSTMWEQAVNVQDPRFIKFWVNRYVRPILWQPVSSARNVWFELDESAFNWGVYGVLDDSNHFVAGVPWDSPFPQNGTAYLAGVASFFNQLVKIAPDVKVAPNVGTMSDPTKFTSVFANIPGVINEDIYLWHSNFSTYTRNNWYAQNMTYFPWLASLGRVQILRAVLPSGDSKALLSSFAMYSLLKGPNSFFAPGTTTTNVSPSQWIGMKSLLGDPIGSVASVQSSGLSAGYRLYSRKFDGGTVYLNFSGSSKTITLDSRYLHWDPYGNQITKLTIADGAGSFETTVREQIPVTAPRLLPRTGSKLTSPASVTVVADTPNSVVYYTTDGSTPTKSSHVYSGPFSLPSGGTVKTRAYMGTAPSWYSNVAMATVSSPTAQLSVASDSGPAGTYYPVVALNGISTGTVTVTYSVRQSSGSTTTGTASVLAGQSSRFFAVPVSGARGAVTRISLLSVSGGSLGAASTLNYTIQ